jgi:2-polyprenyl-6-hydroxyphenyl methylase/3-demethylubiquinone-9 3-methyltransferase
MALDFLDIGCGSGIRSLAAHQAGAGKIHGFDYDENSVNATKIMRR